MRKFLLVLTLLVVNPQPLFAMPKLTFELRGTIESVDLRNSEIRIRPISKEKVRAFAWHEDTTFIKGREKILVSEIKPGQSVRAYYRAPIIGHAFVKRVILEDAPSNK